MRDFLALCGVIALLAASARCFDHARRWWVANRPDPGDGTSKAKWLCLLCNKNRVTPSRRVCWLCRLKRAAREWAR